METFIAKLARRYISISQTQGVIMPFLRDMNPGILSWSFPYHLPLSKISTLPHTTLTTKANKLFRSDIQVFFL